MQSGCLFGFLSVKKLKKQEPNLEVTPVKSIQVRISKNDPTTPGKHHEHEYETTHLPRQRICLIHQSYKASIANIIRKKNCCYSDKLKSQEQKSIKMPFTVPSHSRTICISSRVNPSFCSTVLTVMLRKHLTVLLKRHQRNQLQHDLVNTNNT